MMGKRIRCPAEMCVPACAHQENRDHTLLAAGFEILPRPSMKKKTTLWSSDFKLLEPFCAKINFSTTEGVLGKGSSGQQLCWHRLPVAQGWWKRGLGRLLVLGCEHWGEAQAQSELLSCVT